MTFFNSNNTLISTYKTSSGPGVLFVASSQEVYANVGGNCSQTTFSNVIPSTTKSGDLILALIFARSPITDSSGFALVASQNNAGTTTGQYSAMYMKTASASDANSTVTFTQSLARRAAISIMVLRASVGTIMLDTFSTNSEAASFPPLPIVQVSSKNSIAVAISSTTIAYIISDRCTEYSLSFSAPASYTQITNSTGNACESCTNPRICAGYRLLADNAETDADSFIGIASPANCGQVIAIFKDSASSPTTPIL